MIVYIVCSKDVDNNNTVLHSAFYDIDKAREQIEELREDDEYNYYYLEEMSVEDVQDQQT